MRVGYAIGSTDVIQGIMTCRIPFNVNLVAQIGAMAAMDDWQFVKKTREHNVKEMAFLREGLSQLPVTVPPSQTNFLMIDTNKDAQWLFTELQKQGVIVRPMGSYHFPGGIRVSPGLREDNERFLNALRPLVLSQQGLLQQSHPRGF